MKLKMCQFCQHIFSTKGNLNRHIANGCYDKSSNKPLDKSINKSINKVNKLNNKSDSKSFPISQINDFISTPTLDDISDDEMRKIIQSEEKCIQYLIEYFYVNTKRFHNIYINNIRSKYALIYTKQVWIEKEIKEILDILITNMKQLIENYIDCNKFKLNKICLKVINIYFGLLTDENQVFNNTINDIKYMLINRRKIVMKTYHDQ